MEQDGHADSKTLAYAPHTQLTSGKVKDLRMESLKRTPYANLVISK